ncbi:MAG: Flp pilus assembly protein CpaB [Pseudomonadota bacterium]
MRIVAILILVAGAAIAGFAVFEAKKRFDAEEAELRRIAAEIQAQSDDNKAVEQAVSTKPVVVAVNAMNYGRVLTADDVRIVNYPEEAVPDNAFATLEDLLGAEGAEEKRIILREVSPNEPILRSKVTGFGERATISAQLTPGMRAFTLRIDTVTGVAGFLLPNDRVDVFLTKGSRDGLTSNLIMQNVKVIAVDQLSGTTSAIARVANTATVEVTPEQAQKLALAQQVGRISLSLRQIDEVAETDAQKSVDIDDIIEREEVAAPAPAPAPKKRLCVRKGTELICN